MLDPGTLLLLAITDDLRDGVEGLVARAGAAVRGGATMVQLRLKHAPARDLVEVARALVATLPVPVLVNDRADVAIAAGAAGVHLGTDDLPVVAVRSIAPRGFIIGASCGADRELHHASSADYAGVGPVFGTASKSDAGDAIGVAGFKRIRERLSCPVVAIGGITPENAPVAMRAGAAGVAVIRAVFAAADVENAARQLRSAIDSPQDL